MRSRALGSIRIRCKAVANRISSVSGPWRITFEFESGDAYRVDLEQYH